MPLIQSETLVNASVEKLYALAKDVEKFPEIMPDVESVVITCRDGPRTVSEWVGIIRQFQKKVRWTEEDFWEEEKRRCEFKMIKGDFSKYEGVWEFFSEGAGSRMTLVLDYEFNVPLIGSVIKGVVHNLVKGNCNSMMEALKKAAEND